MGGATNTAKVMAFAKGIAFLVGLTLLGLEARAEERVPVVKIQQPISLVSHACDVCAGGACDCPPSALGCDTGPTCGAAAGVPCDSAGCDTAPAPVCGLPSGATCDAGCATPSCGAPLNAPTCGLPVCGTECCDDAGSCGGSCGLLGGSTCDASGSCGALGNCGLLGGCGNDDINWSRCLNLCCKQGFWIRAESLLWWGPSNDIPALATSSPLGTPIGDAGTLGLPSTTTLFGGSIFGDLQAGGRIRFGTYATPCKLGIDGSLWGVWNDDDSSWSSDGDPAYARPFFNVDPLVNAEDAQLISFDSVLRGTLNINTSSEILGGDIGLRKNLCCSSDACSQTSRRLDGYLGYRYFRVNEGVRISEQLESIALTGPTVLGTTIDLFDDFQTRNEFHGATIGVVGAMQKGRWTTEVLSRVAFGNISRQVTIAGANTLTVPGVAPVTNVGGILAQSTNIGVYEEDDFAVLPEVQVNLSYAVKCNMRLNAGYSFMYLGDIVRPGDIMDRSVNGQLLDPTLPVTGPSRPSFAWNDSTMWLMGLNLGVEVNF